MTEQSTSEKLYHYTDPAGMIGILLGQSIWATDAQYLNDTREVAIAAKRMSSLLYQKAAEFERPDAGAKQDHATQLRTAADAIKKVGTVQRSNGQPVSGSSRRVFVTCFSSEHDSLSQWRGYGAHGGGYAIGFDRNKMSRFRYNFAKVETDPLKIPRIAQGVAHLDWELDLLNSHSVKGSDRTAPPVKVRYGEVELDQFCKQTVDSISEPLEPSLAVELTSVIAYVMGASKLGLVKDGAFRDEREWRLVVSEPARSPLTSGFHAGR